MHTFPLWLALDESGRLDTHSFNELFRDQLEQLILRVREPARRAELIAARNFNWMAYLLASLRSAGIEQLDEREQAAAEIAEYLLVKPGNLFRGFVPSRKGSLQARFAVSVRNAIANWKRDEQRQLRRIGSFSGQDFEPGVVDVPDGLVDDFRQYLSRELGTQAVELVDRRLDGQSLAAIARSPAFEAMGLAGVRRLLMKVREAAKRYEGRVNAVRTREE